MPNIKSAKKRVDLNEKNKAMNKSYKSELATAMKKYVKAVEDGDKDLATKLLPETFAILDKNVARNIIHKNKADRKKAEFNGMLQKMNAKVEEPKKAVKAEKVEATKVEVEEKAEPAKKTARKTATKKATETDAEKPARKTATKKATETDAEKPAKKTTRKTATKKAE